MKYLKPYQLFESFESYKDIIQYLKDVSLELKDDGHSVYISKPISNIIFTIIIKGYKYRTEKISQNKFNNQNLESISNVLEHMVSYMNDLGFDNIIMTRDNGSFFKERCKYDKSKLNSWFSGSFTPSKIDVEFIKSTELSESVLLNLNDNTDKHLMSIIERNIPVGSNILEISCGNGSDAEYLKNNGYNIICTELDDSYIDNVKSKGIECIKQNTKDKFPFQDGQFDLVYSRLGLHYFTEDELDSIFKELSRISDKVLITVKIEDDEFKTGKIILTPDKWFEIINKYFNIEVFDIKQGLLYGKPSKWLEVFTK